MFDLVRLPPNLSNPFELAISHQIEDAGLVEIMRRCTVGLSRIGPSKRPYIQYYKVSNETTATRRHPRFASQFRHPKECTKKIVQFFGAHKHSHGMQRIDQNVNSKE